MKDANSLQALVAPEYWEALEKCELLALNGIGYCKNTFDSFREWLATFLESVPQEIQNLSYNFSLILSHLPILGNNFSHSHIVVIRECPQNNITHIKIFQ